jgi:hypothetical protein
MAHGMSPRWQAASIVASASTVLLLAFAIVAPIASAAPPASAGIASAAAVDAPQLAAEDAIAADVLKSLTNARTAPDGTVFAGVRIAPDGSVTAGPLYGAPARDERFATIVRGMTERLRFRPGDGATRTWAVYWMFQSNACEPPVYDVPPDVTPIRVCLAVRNGTLVAPRSAVWFGRLAELRAGHEEGSRMPQLREGPSTSDVRDLEGRVVGRAILALTLNRDGTPARVEFRQSFGGEKVRSVLTGWANGTRWKVPASWWATHPDHVFHVWYEFAISDDCRKESEPRTAPGMHLVYTCRPVQIL